MFVTLAHIDAAMAPVESKGQKRRQRALRSLLRPGPTIGELLGSVVVFRKKRNWRKGEFFVCMLQK